MTDEYRSRLQALARQNRGVKLVKNIEKNQIEVELEDGRSEWRLLEDVVNYRDTISESRKK